MKCIEDFAGVWKRTVLYEPIGELGPEEEQRKDIIWIQGADGYFIDIRYEIGAQSHIQMKSFAGSGNYDSSTAHFTWSRTYDFRPAGSPDVGLMRVIKGSNHSPEQLEEDGVLPGDNYREIWDKISVGCSETDCTAKLSWVDKEGVTSREGIFLVVGDWFAVTLSRATKANSVDVINKAFNSDVNLTAEENEHLWEYVAAMGSSSTWEVRFALQPALRGVQLLPNTDTVSNPLSELFDAQSGWKWHFVSGKPPEALAGRV